jgi:hypothetical protein
MASPRFMRRVTAIATALALLAACGPSDDAVDEEAAIDPPAAEEAEPEPEPEEEAPPPFEREPLYYPASELFLPQHPLDGLEVDFFATLNTLDETVAWFESNLENLDEFTVSDSTVNGARLWVAERGDAAPGEVLRIEVADSEAHSDQGSIAEVAEVIPPGAVIIAISYVP